MNEQELKDKIEKLELENKELKRKLRSKPRHKEEDYSSWEFHWDGRGDYEEARRCFYGAFG